MDIAAFVQQLPDAPALGSIAANTLITAIRIAQQGDNDTARNIIMYAPVPESTKGAVIAHLNTMSQQGTEATEDLVLPTEMPTSETLTRETTNTQSSTTAPLSSSTAIEIAMPELPTSTPSTSADSATLLQHNITTAPKNELHAILDSTLSDTASSSRSSEFSALFEKITSGTNQEESAPLQNPTQETQVPAPLETPTQSPVARILASQDSPLQHYQTARTNTKAYELFKRSEEYLSKAYQQGNKYLILSAERQLHNLLQQFPEFVSAYPQDVARVRAFRDTHRVRVNELSIGGMTVSCGMKITSPFQTYSITTIYHHEPSYSILFADNDNHHYVVSDTELEQALSDDAIDTDKFFKNYRVLDDVFAALDHS